MSSLRYLVYIRKSSESEERQELSIPAQARELSALAARKNLQIVGSAFEEAMSAKEPGRPVFAEVLSRIERGNADGILCWKLDRLARNPVDGGRIMYSLGKGIIKEIATPERVYVGSGDDKLLMSIIFGMATKYSDDLSDNVRRGNREALLSGRWPGKPKLGYRRDRDSMRLIPDPERFEAVKHLWQLLLGGARPLDILRAAREELALTTPSWGRSGGHLISKSELYRIFRSTFYAGLMVRNGESFAGSHHAMVTMAEFDAAQALLDGHVRPLAKSQGLFFTYGGLIRCARCSAAVVATHATNRYGTRYVYYRCCRKERRYSFCPEPAIQEKVIESQLVSFFDRVLPPERWLSRLVERLAAQESSERLISLEAGRKRAGRVDEIDRTLVRARDLVAKGLFSEEEYLSDRQRLMIERQRLLEDVADPNGRSLVQPLVEAVERLRKAKILFANGTPEERREILSALTYNLSLDNRILHVSAKKPIMAIGSWSKFPSWSAWRVHVTTFLMEPTDRSAVEGPDAPAALAFDLG
jgi:DNA invertase Pin-like site-specific DNA recombinase